MQLSEMNPWDPENLWGTSIYLISVRGLEHRGAKPKSQPPEQKLTLQLSNKKIQLSNKKLALGFITLENNTIKLAIRNGLKIRACSNATNKNLAS